MKNISRRNFMKCAAAASLAVATSAVLTGCKLPVGTESKDEQTGFQPITQTVEIGHENFDLTVNGYEYDNDSKLLAVDVTAKNYTDQDVKFTTATSTKGDAAVTAYADAVTALDDNALDKAGAVTGVSVWEKSVPKKTATSAGVVNGKLYFTVKSDYKNWNAVTMIVDVNVDGTNTETMKFVINR